MCVSTMMTGRHCACTRPLEREDLGIPCEMEEAQGCYERLSEQWSAEVSDECRRCDLLRSHMNAYALQVEAEGLQEARLFKVSSLCPVGQLTVPSCGDQSAAQHPDSAVPPYLSYRSAPPTLCISLADAAEIPWPWATP